MIDRPAWKTAPPLWRDGLAGTVEIDRPEILRFDGDDFMERLQAELDATERDVAGFVVQPETWRGPGSGVGASQTGEVPRLYQPAHGRFYLVVGSLVCERYGLPDKRIHPGCDESVFGVLRRLEPTGADPVDPALQATYRELGWVPEGDRGAWVDAPLGIATGEQRLPVFPMTYVDGSRRRVLATMVPVAARERYEAAMPSDPVPATPADPAAVLVLPGRARLDSVVLGLESALRLAGAPTMVAGTEATRDGLREAVFFALVDLAAFLVDELPDVWSSPSTTSGRTHDLARLLLDEPCFGTTWHAALHTAHANRHLVLAELTAPPAPVAAVTLDQVVAAIAALGVTAAVPTTREAFFTTVADALDERPQAAVGSASSGAGAGGGGSAGSGGPRRSAGAVYAVRLVYERPRCPEPGRTTVSRPSRAFRLAHFHDPDAPFRDNRIVLPIDTSLEGLRKFPKGVRMEVSAQLRTQLERIQAIKLKDLDDGDIPDESPLDLGMVCQLSIPIITICALVLLMIVVSLLNLVFFWVPLFKICLPKAP